MFLQDKLPKNKDINYLERNESSHPLLQIIYRNKNKDNIISPKTLKTSTISSSTNLLNKNSNNNTLNITSKLDLTKTLNINLFNNKKSINSPIFSDVSHNSNNNKINNSHEENKKKFKRNLIGKRKTVNPTKKKIIFPSLNSNTNNSNRMSATKKGLYENNTNEKNKENDIFYNNTNFNNNSIYVSEPGKRNYIFQRFKGDKVLCQKIIELSLFKKNSSNKNINLYKNSTRNDQLPQLNTEINDKKKDNKNKSNNLINKFMKEKNEVHKKFNKRKSVNFSSNHNLLEAELENNKETVQNNIDKSKGLRKSFLNILPRNNNININNNLAKSMQTFVPEKKVVSPMARKRINIRQCTSLLNMKKITMNLAAFKRSMLRKKTKEIKMNPFNNDNMKAIGNIRNNIRHVTTTFINKDSNFLFGKKNNQFKNNLNSIFDENSEYSDSSRKIIILRKKSKCYGLNNVLTQQYISKDEEDYIQKKRFKLIQEVEKSNKSSNLYNSYNGEIKNYFLKNYVIDKITQNIFQNFEPVENKTENKKQKIQKREIQLKQIFNDILIKSHKVCYSFEKMQKLGISYLKKVKIITQLKVKNNYILGKFDIYKKLLRQFKNKWNKQKKKNIIIKKD